MCFRDSLRPQLPIDRHGIQSLLKRRHVYCGMDVQIWKFKYGSDSGSLLLGAEFRLIVRDTMVAVLRMSTSVHDNHAKPCTNLVKRDAPGSEDWGGANVVVYGEFPRLHYCHPIRQSWYRGHAAEASDKASFRIPKVHDSNSVSAGSVAIYLIHGWLASGEDEVCPRSHVVPFSLDWAVGALADMGWKCDTTVGDEKVEFVWPRVWRRGAPRRQMSLDRTDELEPRSRVQAQTEPPPAQCLQLLALSDQIDGRPLLQH
ncbi:hypothetical protein C8Q74DRAFT_107545 [Fomes fomentarius]|nr:hypothetical protein C8Q74DRAFT_107545 [Fomes fomentarius]